MSCFSSRAATAVDKAVDSATELGGENAGYAIAPTILGGIKVDQELGKALTGEAPLFSIGIGAGFSSEKNEQKASSSTPVVTEICSGGSTAIYAGNDIMGHRVQIAAGIDADSNFNVGATAGNDVNFDQC